jgi:Ca2+-binding RTX toxin-like protein
LPIGYTADMNTNEHKQRAAELGLEWSAVLALYREARQLEAAEVERAAEVRRDAFRAQSGDTHGGRFKMRHRAAFNGGDATYIQGLDVVAADRGSTADELFADLAADAVALRDADAVMAETIDRAAALAAPADDAADMMPLVQAAHVADVTEQWLRQLVKAGRIRGRKVGRNWIVSRADVTYFDRHPTAGRPRREAAPF